MKLNIGLTSNFNQVLLRMQGLDSQLPFATALALTRTAQDLRDAERREMLTVFDRPTPYTLRSLFLKPATKAKPEAQVWLKDDRAGSGTPATRYLLPQIEGGPRGMKGLERQLQRIGMLAADERVVPGAAAKLDSYGNISRGQIMQIRSQIGVAQQLAGVTANASNSKRSRAKRASVEYFRSYGPTSERRMWGASKRYGRGLTAQHLPKGIWQRTTFALGTAVKPVLLVVKQPHYSKRFDFFGVAERVVSARLPYHLDQAITRALATAWQR